MKWKTGNIEGYPRIQFPVGSIREKNKLNQLKCIK